jgi:error-prone DNA polymerase
VKFDLLGLGMLTALHLMIDLVAEHHGAGSSCTSCSPSTRRLRDARAGRLGRGVPGGVPRPDGHAAPAQPRVFYDLVVEVALIRPGPIQGGSVHPYIRRRNGLEEPTYDHPLLTGRAGRRPSACRCSRSSSCRSRWTSPGFSAGDADELRRAMGSKRSTRRWSGCAAGSTTGMAATGITGEVRRRSSTRCWRSPNFGFPESHSISFASLGLLQRLVQALPPCGVLRGAAQLPADGLLLTAVAGGRRAPARGGRGRPGRQRRRAEAILFRDGRSTGGLALRLGLAEVRTIGLDLAESIDAERERGGPFSDPRRSRRAGAAHLRAGRGPGHGGGVRLLRSQRGVGAGPPGGAVGGRVVASVRAEHLPGTAVGLEAPALPGLTAAELTVADVWATGVSPDSHPIQHLRAQLDGLGAIRIDRLAALEPPSDPEAQPPRVLVGGLVTHRQRPATAGGVTFVNLEDESGMLNVTCSEGCGRATARWRWAARHCSCGDGWSAAPRGCSTWWPTGCRSWPWPSP